MKISLPEGGATCVLTHVSLLILLPLLLEVELLDILPLKVAGYLRSFRYVHV